MQVKSFSIAVCVFGAQISEHTAEDEKKGQVGKLHKRLASIYQWSRKQTPQKVRSCCHFKVVQTLIRAGPVHKLACSLPRFILLPQE